MKDVESIKKSKKLKLLDIKYKSFRVETNLKLSKWIYYLFFFITGNNVNLEYTNIVYTKFMYVLKSTHKNEKINK